MLERGALRWFVMIPSSGGWMRLSHSRSAVGPARRNRVKENAGQLGRDDRDSEVEILPFAQDDRLCFGLGMKRSERGC